MMKIYEAKNHLLVYAEGIRPIKHAHMAAHIIISLDGIVDVMIENCTYSCTGIAIPAGIEHSVIANGSKFLVFLYDSSTSVAKRIRDVKIVSPAACDRIIRQYCLLEQTDHYNTYDLFERNALQELGIADTSCGLTDGRILDAMGYVQRNLSDKIFCKTVADAVFLSESRFSHLFREQLGMTFAAYLIYQRLMCVYSKIFSGIPITEAALAAGFSSSSHFSDVSRRVFGLSASKISKGTRFVKIQ